MFSRVSFHVWIFSRLLQCLDWFNDVSFQEERAGTFYGSKATKTILHKIAKDGEKTHHFLCFKRIVSTTSRILHLPTNTHIHTGTGVRRHGIDEGNNLFFFSPFFSSAFSVMHKELLSLFLFPFLAFCTKPTQYRYPKCLCISIRSKSLSLLTAMVSPMRIASLSESYKNAGRIFTEKR